MNTHFASLRTASLALIGSFFALACGSPVAPVAPAASPPLDAGATAPATPAPQAATTPPASAAARPPFARDGEGIRAAIRSRSAGVGVCFKEFSAGRANAEAEVTMRVVVDPTGVVSVAEQGKPLVDTAPAQPNAVPRRPAVEDAVLSACIAKELKQMQFLSDAKGKETRVDYPLQLSAKRIAEGRI